MRKLTLEQIIEELSFGDAMWQFVRFDEESDAFVYSITRTQEDGSLAEELILYDGDMEDLPYAEEEAFKRQIARELRSGVAKLQFVRFDAKTFNFVYSITRTLKDGSLAEELILFDGNMDELLSVLEDSLSEEEKED